MPIEQIADHMGNSFTPNRVRHTLYRAGWRLTERHKQGCVWLVRRMGGVCTTRRRPCECLRRSVNVNV